MLIDCGEGTQMRFRDLGEKESKIERIFISHLHGDHYFGLVGMLTTWQLLGRTRPLTVHGPKELWPIVEAQVDVRRLGYPCGFESTQTQTQVLIAEHRNYTVESFPLEHAGFPTTGFLFREKPSGRRINGEKAEALRVPISEREGLRWGADARLEDGTVISNEELTIPGWKSRSYAYCSDTGYFLGLAAIVESVDLLYHEATYLNEHADLAAERGHSTAEEAARTAATAGAGLLLLGHFSSRYPNPAPLLREAKEVFEHSELALEGKRFEVSRQEAKD